MTQRQPVILLVDDDADFIEINRHVLEAAGYSVLPCHDVQGAMTALASQHVDLVLTDLMMKSLDSGFEFAKALKADERLRGIPIIMATSVTSQMGLDFRPRTPQDLQAMGIDAYFDKPIPPKKLIEKVHELLSNKV